MNGTTHALALGSSISNSGAGARSGVGAASGAGSGAGGGGGAGAQGYAASNAPRRAPPAIFCLALAWESASAEREVIAQTLSNISPTLDLGLVYERVPKVGCCNLSTVFKPPDSTS